MKSKIDEFIYRINEGRISYLFLASFFCAFLLSTGCGREVTMHPVSDVASEYEVGHDLSDSQLYEKDNSDVTSDVDKYSKMITDQHDSQGDTVVVHICGAIKDPGVYELDEGSRIIDAIGLAGGFTDEADEEAINLAIILQDGIRIYIPNTTETSNEAGVYITGYDTSSQSQTQVGNQTTKSGKININTADESKLQEIKGIGQTRAQSIIAYREASGPFKTIEDIKNVSGIGEASFEKMKDMITVD